jgi:hypothetical protein
MKNTNEWTQKSIGDWKKVVCKGVWWAVCAWNVGLWRVWIRVGAEITIAGEQRKQGEIMGGELRYRETSRIREMRR